MRVNIGEQELRTYALGETGKVNYSNPIVGNNFDNLFTFNSLSEDSFSREEKDEVTDFLDSISYSNEAVKKALDINGDGVISSEEKAKFKEYIKGYDGNLSDLTQDDILRAFYDINNEKFSYNNDVQLRAQELDNDVEFNTKYSQNNSITDEFDLYSQFNNFGCMTNNFASGMPQSSNSYLNNMSLTQLENEKASQKGVVNEAREAVNDVYSGKNNAVLCAENKYNEAKEQYDEALKNDENVSKELKEQRACKVEEIENQENNVDTTNININNKKGEISDQEGVIASDEATICELESQLAALNSQSSDDPEKQAAIEAQKQQVQAQIQQAQEQLNSDKETLECLKQDLSQLENDLAVQEEKLQNLEAEKIEIDNKISETCSNETKQALICYNQAKNNLDTTKETQLRYANANLKNQENKLKDIDTKINEKKVIVADDEWKMVADNNIDLSEKLENGEPRYIIAQGKDDNKYHVYDMSKNSSIKQVETGNNRMYNFTKTNSDSGSKVCYMDSNGEMCCFNACYTTESPLSFDINGDGIKTSDEIISYDIDGDGNLDNIFDSADAVLVFDKDGNGISGEDGSECFGNNTDLNGDNVKDGFNDGFEALKEFAKQNNLINGNDDNVLDEKDIKYLEENFGFKIKLNGYNSEAVSLSEAGITEINLAQTEDTSLIDNFDGNGNQLMEQEGATFKVNGETREYADLWHKLVSRLG